MIRRPIPMLAALTVGLVGCNDEVPVFFDTGNTDTGTGNNDTGTATDSGTTTDTGTGTDTGRADTGGPDDAGTVSDAGGADTEPTDTGTPEDTGTPITPDIEAVLAAYCGASAECNPEYTEEQCLEYVAAYAQQLEDEYGTECLDAYATMFDCVVTANDCVEGELSFDSCDAEFQLAQEICGFE